MGGWNHPSWSISAEWFAYLAFPLFAAGFWPLRQRTRLAVGLAVRLLIGLNVGFEHLAGFPLTRATILWGALRIVPCFALGCGVWLVWRADLIKSAPAAVAALAASCGAIVATLLIGGPDWLSVSLFGALILCLASLTSTGSRLLSGASWVYPGEVSFAVYMVCIPWQLVFTRVVEKLAPATHDSLAWGTWLVMFAGVVPVAMLAHHLVERPAREVMRKHGVPFRGRRGPLAARVAQVAAARR